MRNERIYKREIGVIGLIAGDPLSSGEELRTVLPQERFGRIDIIVPKHRRIGRHGIEACERKVFERRGSVSGRREHLKGVPMENRFPRLIKFSMSGKVSLNESRSLLVAFGILPDCAPAGMGCLVELLPRKSQSR